MSDFTQPMILTTSARLPFTSVPQTYELYRQKSEKRKAEAEIAETRINIRVLIRSFSNTFVHRVKRI